MGTQIRPEVYRTMKAIFSVVISEAAIMRSPSFSRDRSSRTTMNSPFSVQMSTSDVQKRVEWSVKGTVRE